MADKRIFVGTHISADLRDRLDQESVRRGTRKRPPSERTQARIIRDALEAYLKQQELVS